MSEVHLCRLARTKYKGLFYQLVCYLTYYLQDGDRGSTVVKVLCYKSKVAGSIPPGVI